MERKLCSSAAFQFDLAFSEWPGHVNREITHAENLCVNVKASTFQSFGNRKSCQ